jgi:RNA polymerase sigma-70 factor, ECF subfamily
VEDLILLGPETRHSLISKLTDAAATQAWDEFVHLYQPVIYRVARGKGLQHADAEDLTQEVFATVGRKVGEFDCTRGGSFRGWLQKITRDLVINKLTRRPIAIGSGDSEALLVMQQHPDRAQTTTLLILEHRRALLARAAAKLRSTFTSTTWDCFWLTAVDGMSITAVAQRLNKTPGAVRVARCRVLTKLKQEIQNDDSAFLE